jgi:hypothetical protein
MRDPSSTSPRYRHSKLRAKSHVVRTGPDGAARQEAITAVHGSLEKAGLDLARFDELRRRSRAELEAVRGSFLAAAEERAPAMQDVVARSAEHWRKSKGVFTTPPPSGGIYSVDTAEVIVADGLELRSEHIAPWANTAQVVLQARTGDIQEIDASVTFIFKWPNATGQDAVCTVTGLLGVTATTDVTADSYWWPLDPTPPASRLDAYAGLGLLLVDANGQVTSPAYQDTQEQGVVHIYTFADWLSGTMVGQDIFRGYVLQYTDLLVPATSSLELYLSCQVSWLAHAGGGDFIAAGDGRQISGFGLVISTQPAIV